MNYRLPLIIMALPLFLILFAAMPSHAQSVEKVENLRRSALLHLDNNEPEPARALTRQAAAEATHIRDPYTRANQLRYVAELYYRLGEKDEASQCFSKELEAAQHTTPIYRKLSAFIGLVEMRKKLGDTAGLRESALAILGDGILEEVAASGDPGEINRFLSNLSGAISPEDMETLLRAHIARLPDTAFRKRVLYKLNEITLVAMREPEKEEASPLTLPPSADAFERVLWLALLAKIEDARGNPGLAAHYLHEAETASANCENKEKCRHILSIQ